MSKRILLIGGLDGRLDVQQLPDLPPDFKAFPHFDKFTRKEKLLDRGGINDEPQNNNEVFRNLRKLLVVIAHFGDGGEKHFVLKAKDSAASICLRVSSE